MLRPLSLQPADLLRERRGAAVARLRLRRRPAPRLHREGDVLFLVLPEVQDDRTADESGRC